MGGGPGGRREEVRLRGLKRGQESEKRVKLREGTTEKKKEIGEETKERETKELKRYLDKGRNKGERNKRA